MDKSRAKVGHGASALGPEGTGSNDLWLPGEYCNDVSPVISRKMSGKASLESSPPRQHSSNKGGFVALLKGIIRHPP